MPRRHRGSSCTMMLAAKTARTMATVATVAKQQQPPPKMTIATATGGGGGGDEDDAGSGRPGPTTPFILKRTDCHVSLSLSGAGRMQMLEVLLHASSLVVLSSESATPATVPVNNGIQSAAASANREELARAKGGAKDMGGRPGHPSSADADGDLARLGILPLPGKWGHATADKTTTNGSGTNKLPPANHGVSPSHPMADQF